MFKPKLGLRQKTVVSTKPKKGLKDDFSPFINDDEASRKQLDELLYMIADQEEIEVEDLMSSLKRFCKEFFKDGDSAARVCAYLTVYYTDYPTLRRFLRNA